MPVSLTYKLTVGRVLEECTHLLHQKAQGTFLASNILTDSGYCWLRGAAFVMARDTIGHPE
jgi:hypothetical protein